MDAFGNGAAAVGFHVYFVAFEGGIQEFFCYLEGGFAAGEADGVAGVGEEFLANLQGGHLTIVFVLGVAEGATEVAS